MGDGGRWMIHKHTSCLRTHLVSSCTQGEGTAELGMGGVSTWEIIDQYQFSDDEEDKAKKPPKTSPSNAERASEGGPSCRIEPDVIEIKSDSEEDETVVLTKDDFSGARRTKAAAVAPSLTDLVTLESQKEVTKLSEGVKELSTTGPSEQTTIATAVSPAKSKQKRGRGRRGEKTDSAAASSADVEVVCVTPGDSGRGGRGGGKVKGAGQGANSGTGGSNSGSSRGRGKRRKSNPKTH